MRLKNTVFLQQRAISEPISHKLCLYARLQIHHNPIISTKSPSSSPASPISASLSIASPSTSTCALPAKLGSNPNRFTKEATIEPHFVVGRTETVTSLFPDRKRNLKTSLLSVSSSRMVSAFVVVVSEAPGTEESSVEGGRLVARF